MSGTTAASKRGGAKAPKANKEALILSVACKLFATHGFAGTSIRDIADAAGISNAALYHFFADKNELFGRIFLNVTQNLCSFVEGRIVPTDSASDQVRAFMRGYGQFFEDHPDECIAASLSFRALEELPMRVEAIYWRDRYEGTLRAIIRQGIASGEFAEDDPAMTGRAILSCLNWLHRWYNPAGQLRPVEIVEHYADILLRGIRAQAGKTT